METEPKIKPDWHVVAIDETWGYTIADEDKDAIEKILGVYAYNRNSHTHCCEITPSYFMTYCYTTIVYKDPFLALEGDDAFESRRDAIEDRYVYCGGNEDIYMHVSSVERRVENKTFDHYHYGAVDVDAKDDGEDEAREHLNGNPPF